MLLGTIMLLRILLLAIVLVLRAGTSLAAEPPFSLTEDGSAFLYSARPGDQPGTVAAMFGIGVNELPAFLAANGVKDPARITIGQVFRIPNPLASRAVAAESKVGALEKELAEQRTRAERLDRELGESRATAEEAQKRADRLAGLERWSHLLGVIGVVLVLGLAAAGSVAHSALRKFGEAESHARNVAVELDEKRRALLAERQRAAKREMDLEAQVRELEQQVASAGRVRRPAAR
jgi:hypothetical protein